MSIRIKICGITKTKEASYLNEAKVDYAGFVFYEKSKRNINVDTAKEIFKALAPNIKKVAVMVSPSVELVNSVQAAGFDILQIHKQLTKEVLACANIPVWYAVNIEDEAEADEKLRYIEQLPEDLSKKIEGFVVDAPKFGSGQTFNWKKSKRLKKAGAQSPPNDRMFILAGGLNSDNVAEGISIFNPDVVDISSNVEGSDGKDRDLIMAFANSVRKVM